MLEHEPFLRIPPFPGAKVHSLVRPRELPAEDLSDDQADRIIAEVERLGVGGAYWSTHRKKMELSRECLRKWVIEPFDYIDPFSGEPISIEEAVRLCGFWRQLIESNRRIGGAVGFAFWKQPTVAPLLWNGDEEVNFVSHMKDVDTSRAVAVWKARTPARLLAALAESGAPIVEVEDGFIRSAGLGADCVPPLSIVTDELGVHFDPSRASELENLIARGLFEPDLLERARQLRDIIVVSGVGKYGSAKKASWSRDVGRRIILVPGQVEDDRAILLGTETVRTNLELLRRVRDEQPDAYIVYKPHPDVEAGHRVGGAGENECLGYANEIASGESIGPLIDAADEVHVMTSLAGFEALMRDRPVTTYGAPFYAGWGLTRDLGPIPARRTAKRNLDELIAAVLLLYPRYLDPVTGLPCPPEVLIQRLVEPMERPGMVVQLRRLQGRLKRISGARRA